MRQAPDVHEVAGALRVSIGLLLRRLRQVQADGELTLPESSALARLDRGGPATSSALARLEQISPQSMGATLARARGAWPGRAAPRPGGRQAGRALAVTEAGLQALRNKRNARAEQLAQALSAGFTPSELEQLMAAAPLLERLAQSI